MTLAWRHMEITSFSCNYCIWFGYRVAKYSTSWTSWTTSWNLKQNTKIFISVREIWKYQHCFFICSSLLTEGTGTILKFQKGLALSLWTSISCLWVKKRNDCQKKEFLFLVLIQCALFGPLNKPLSKPFTFQWSRDNPTFLRKVFSWTFLKHLEFLR